MRKFIFVTGFQRSGTTLLRRLINAHPNAKILHETRLIKHSRTRADMYANFDLYFGEHHKYIGEKVPYMIKAAQPLAFIRKWFDFFGEHGRVIHIIRHPVDVTFSNMKKLSPKKSDLYLTQYIRSVPRVIDEVNKNKLCMNVVFEDLVYSPRMVIEEVFKFCEIHYNPKILIQVLDAPMRYFNGVNPDRGYAFEREGRRLKIKIEIPDYNELLKRARNG
jgi:hypothetical protein